MAEKKKITSQKYHLTTLLNEHPLLAFVHSTKQCDQNCNGNQALDYSQLSQYVVFVQ